MKWLSHVLNDQDDIRVGQLLISVHIASGEAPFAGVEEV